MCGIVGIISRVKRDFWTRDLELLEQMLVIDTLRGKDSVGAFSAYKNNEVEAIKLGSNVFNLFKCKEWDQFKDRVQKRGRFVIGHNRAATRGVISTENAHPFAENNIMLVHNGTLYSHAHLSNKKEFDVDSNAIAAALSESTVDEVLPRLHGAFALVWYDTEKKKLFAIRNHERPLCLITTEEAYVISSEATIAAMPMARQGRKIESVDEIPPWTLFEFDMVGNLSRRHVSAIRHSPVNYYSSATKEVVHGPYHQHWGMEDTLDDDVPFVVGEPEKTHPTCALTESSKENAIPANVETTDSKKTTQNSAGRILIQQPKGTTLQSKLTIKELDLIQFTNTKSVQINHPTLTQGKMVVFDTLEISQHASGKYRFQGKLKEFGEELIDVLGFYPAEETLEDLENKWRGKACIGRILYVSSTAGGLSAYIQGAQLATMTEVYAGYKIPMTTWSRLCVSGKCTKCGNDVSVMDREFTAITLKATLQQGKEYPINTATIMCAYCLEDTLKGELKNVFKHKREETWRKAGYPGVRSLSSSIHGIVTASNSDSAVQNREPLSEEFSPEHGKIIVLPGSSTIQ